jgi:hypothetical protein
MPCSSVLGNILTGGFHSLTQVKRKQLAAGMETLHADFHARMLTIVTGHHVTLDPREDIFYVKFMTPLLLRTIVIGLDETVAM